MHVRKKPNHYSEDGNAMFIPKCNLSTFVISSSEANTIKVQLLNIVDV